MYPRKSLNISRGLWLLGFVWHSKIFFNPSANRLSQKVLIAQQRENIYGELLPNNFLHSNTIAQHYSTHFCPFALVSSELIVLYFFFTILPWWLSGKESACQCRRHRRPEFSPWVGKTLWRRKWQPTPVFLPGEFHGQRSLVGYSPWGHKESDMIEGVTVMCYWLSFSIFLKSDWSRVYNMHFNLVYFPMLLFYL